MCPGLPNAGFLGAGRGRGLPIQDAELHPHRAQNPTCMSAQPLVPKSTASVPPNFPQSFLVSWAALQGQTPTLSGPEGRPVAMNSLRKQSLYAQPKPKWTSFLSVPQWRHSVFFFLPHSFIEDVALQGT